MTDIYNNNSYLEKNPTLHIEDSEFKFENIKKFLSSIEVKNNRIKILDIGGGAGIIGKLVLEFFLDSGIIVTFHSLDLSKQMLKIQLKNNPQIRPAPKILMLLEHVYSVLLVSPYIAKLWITSSPEVVNKLHPLGFHLVLGINSLLGHCHDFLQLEILVLLQEVRFFLVSLHR